MWVSEQVEWDRVNEWVSEWVSECEKVIGMKWSEWVKISEWVIEVEWNGLSESSCLLTWEQPLESTKVPPKHSLHLCLILTELVRQQLQMFERALDIHGGEDITVPVKQSHSLFTHLYSNVQTTQQQSSLVCVFSHQNPLHSEQRTANHQLHQIRNSIRIQSYWKTPSFTPISPSILCEVQKGTSILTLFVPSNSEWIASPGPSNIGAKRSKIWVGHEKPNKNGHISTVNTAVLPSLSDTTSLSRTPVYPQSSTHPSSKSSSLCLLSKSIENIYPLL